MPGEVLGEHVVPPIDEEVRLDRYASRVFPCFASRSAARKAAQRGEILIDGEPGHSSRFMREGQRLTVLEPDANPPGAWDRPVEIPWVDDHLAVVVKPPGIPVSGNQHKTLENLLVTPLPPPERADALGWARPVHRLDIRTGGLVVVARTGPAQVGLGHRFQRREVDKRYRAVVIGRLEGEGRVERPVQGRRAVSDWRAVEHSRCLRTDWLTTVELWPRTGRNHQLRRHLAHLGHPVLGDDLYGIEGAILRGKGLFLRSLEVAFEHPVTGEPVQVAIDEPDKFATWRDREARRWRKHHA